jgi:hypothetical protein
MRILTLQKLIKILIQKWPTLVFFLISGAVIGTILAKTIHKTYFYNNEIKPRIYINNYLLVDDLNTLDKKPDQLIFNFFIEEFNSKNNRITAASKVDEIKEKIKHLNINDQENYLNKITKTYRLHTTNDNIIKISFSTKNINVGKKILINLINEVNNKANLRFKKYFSSLIIAERIIDDFNINSHKDFILEEEKAKVKSRVHKIQNELKFFLNKIPSEYSELNKMYFENIVNLEKELHYIESLNENNLLNESIIIKNLKNKFIDQEIRKRENNRIYKEILNVPVSQIIEINPKNEIIFRPLNSFKIIIIYTFISFIAGIIFIILKKEIF